MYSPTRCQIFDIFEKFDYPHFLVGLIYRLGKGPKFKNDQKQAKIYKKHTKKSRVVNIFRREIFKLALRKVLQVLDQNVWLSRLLPVPARPDAETGPMQKVVPQTGVDARGATQGYK